VDLRGCRAKYRALASTLTERSRRVWAATEARALGRGGMALVARATGISTSTIARGLNELRSRARVPPGRVRRPGGGWKRTVDKDPTLLRDLEGLVEPTTSGAPHSPLRWTAKSTRTLARTLQSMGHRISHQLVRELLSAAGYSLHANRKTREGPPHPDRDGQFRHIAAQVRQFQAAGQPVISVDTMGRVVPVSRPCHRSFGLAHHRARDPHEALVEDLHLRLAPLADPPAHPTARRATALGDLEDPARHTARALADPSPNPPQRTGEHPDPVGQERGVRGVVNVGFDDRSVDAQAPASNDTTLAPQGHQPGQHILEHRLVQQAGPAGSASWRVRNALAVDPAERAVHQAAPHLPLALIEAPVVEVLEDQHPQDHGGWCPQSASPPTLRMALGQGLRDSIDEDIVIEKSVDLPEGGIPELVGVGQEHFHEAASVRSPHHGASGEAARPQGVHRVSCAAARRVRSRCSLTIAHRVPHRQRITVHSDRIPERPPAQTQAALSPIRTGK